MPHPRVSSASGWVNQNPPMSNRSALRLSVKALNQPFQLPGCCMAGPPRRARVPSPPMLRLKPNDQPQ